MVNSLTNLFAKKFLPTDTIVRFGLAVHYETEHGEQFNKLIRLNAIVRFGPAVHYETEHGEQVNKFIRHRTSRDVGKRFGERFIIRHLIRGGSYFKDSFVATAGELRFCGR